MVIRENRQISLLYLCTLLLPLSCISRSLPLHPSQSFSHRSHTYVEPYPVFSLTLSILPLAFFLCLDTEMSLPVNSDYLSLERIARYRHACSNGSPYATNKPIDIKPRGRRGYGLLSWTETMGG